MRCHEKKYDRASARPIQCFLLLEKPEAATWENKDADRLLLFWDCCTLFFMLCELLPLGKKLERERLAVCRLDDEV